MPTLTVNIEDKKTEKAIKAVLDTFGLDYNVAKDADVAKRPLSKQEQKMYDRLKKTVQEINLYNEGKVELQDARAFLNEL
jgi:prefoldin subunit 5